MYFKVFIEHDDIRVESDFESTLIQTEKSCGSCREHCRCLGEGKSAFVYEYTEKYVCCRNASCERTSIRKLCHAILDDVLNAAHNAAGRRRSRNAEAVGDCGDIVDALDLDDHADEIGRQMLAVSDDLGTELVAKVGALDDSERAEAVVASYGRGAGVKVGDEIASVIDRARHIGVFCIGVACGNDDSAVGQILAELTLGVALGSISPADYGVARFLEKRDIFVRIRLGDVVGRLRPALCGREVGTLHVCSEQVERKGILLCDLNVLDRLAHYRKRAGGDGGDDGGCAVCHMEDASVHDLPWRGFGEAEASSAVSVDVDESRHNVIARGVDYLAFGCFICNFCDLSVLYNDKSVKNTVRQNDQIAFDDPSHSLKKRRAVGVEVEDRALACAKDRCGAMLVDGGGQGLAYCPSLRRRGYDAEKMRSADEHRNCQRDRVLRYVIDLSEATVIDLLIAADLVELDGLDKLFILEISNGRVVECDMTVLADAHNDDVDLGCGEQGGVARRFLIGIGGVTLDVIDALEGHKTEDVRVKKVTEALRCGGIKTDVFVHVVRIDAIPFDSLVCNERSEHLVLRGSSGEDHGDLVFLGEQFTDLCGDILSCSCAHSGARVVYVDFELVLEVGFHWFTSLCLIG